MAKYRKIIYPLLALAAAYLLGAFVLTDFNIAHWTEYTRGIIAMVGVAAAAIVAIIQSDI
jgi:hypothetical protein